MAVMFTAATDVAGALYVVTCGCPRATDHAQVLPYQEAEAIALAALSDLRTNGVHAPLAGCEEPEWCCTNPLYVAPGEDDESPWVQAHTGNTPRLLDALGIHEEESGVMGAGELLGRVLVALALAPEDCEIPAQGDGRWIVGGREPGGLQRLLTELHDLAQWADSRGFRITWG